MGDTAMNIVLNAILAVEETVTIFLCGAAVFKTEIAAKPYKYFIAVMMVIALSILNGTAGLGLSKAEQRTIYALFTALFLSTEKKTRSIIIAISSALLTHILSMFPYCIMLLAADIQKSDAGNGYLLAANLFCIIFLALTLCLLKYLARNKAYKQERENINSIMHAQERYIDTLLIKDEEIRKFRHDIRAYSAILEGHLASCDYSAARQLLIDINNIVSFDSIGIYTGIAVVDAVINDCCRDMPDNDIKLCWTGRIKGCEKRITEYELCCIFMNIIKNAAETCQKINGHTVINVMTEFSNDELLISADNPVQYPVKFDNCGNPISDKSDRRNHGFGCLKIREITEKYNGVLKYEVLNGRFYVTVAI